MKSPCGEHLRPIPCGVDLFSGAGGFGLGLSAAGFNIVASLDNDADAISTMVANLGRGSKLIVGSDISACEPGFMEALLRRLSTRYLVDLIVGGPPCQGWSRVGRGKLRSLGRLRDKGAPLSDKRNRLYLPFLRYVAYFRPKAVLMENVRGMASYYGYDASESVAKRIASFGYRTKVHLLDAADLGLPQHRRRLLIVGIREDLGAEFKPPKATAAPAGFESTGPTVRDAIHDLPRVSAGSQRSEIPYRPTEKPSPYVRLLRPGWMNGGVTHHIVRWHRPEDLVAFRALPQGGIYTDLPNEMRRYRDDIFADKYRKLAWDEPSPCLTAHLAKDGYSHIHPSQARTISVREAARLQSFPDWYKLSGSMGSQFRQLGNSVPPLLSYRLGLSLRECLGTNSDCSWGTFSQDAAKHFVA